MTYLLWLYLIYSWLQNLLIYCVESPVYICLSNIYLWLSILIIWLISDSHFDDLILISIVFSFLAYWYSPWSVLLGILQYHYYLCFHFYWTWINVSTFVYLVSLILAIPLIIVNLLWLNWYTVIDCWSLLDVDIPFCTNNKSAFL